MQNLNQKTKLVLYPILYWVVFVIVPFLLLLNPPFVIDISLFIMYYLVISPILFIIHLVLLKKEIKNFSRFLLISLIFFVVIHILLFRYLFKLGFEIFSNINFL